jgi:hypothetical protein
MKAKVIRFAPRRTALSLQLDQLVGFEGVKILSGLIHEWHLQNKENRIKNLAQKANLTPTTVSRIMNRDTKSPRMLTCIMLFKALGFSAVRFE